MDGCTPGAIRQDGTGLIHPNEMGGSNINRSKKVDRSGTDMEKNTFHFRVSNRGSVNPTALAGN